MSAASPPSKRKTSRKVSFMGYLEIRENQPPTSYLETLANLFKANVGTGCYAMADAIMHGGIVLGPIMTLLIAVICIHCMHVLARCAEHLMTLNRLPSRPDYSEVVEMSFGNSKSSKWQACSGCMKKTCNIFICITQLGFCCVYFLFVSESIEMVLNNYGIFIQNELLVTLVLVPIWLTTLVRKLKHIAIFSGIANICMIIGALLTIGYAVQGLPSVSERNYVNFTGLPLFFGTALFAFEGIALILPLQNAMKRPQNFTKLFGVLNVGMVLVTVIYLLLGTIGYWKYGENSAASLTLNLPANQILAQIIILMVGLGVMLGYAIQFYVAIEIMFPSISETSRFAEKHPVFSELLFRSIMVLVTFTIAQLVPSLSLLLSLIGSVCCVVLVFVFPTICELMLRHNDEKGIGVWCWLKNLIILLIAFAGFCLGGATALIQIVENFKFKA